MLLNFSERGTKLALVATAVAYLWITGSMHNYLYFPTDLKTVTHTYTNGVQQTCLPIKKVRACRLRRRIQRLLRLDNLFTMETIGCRPTDKKAYKVTRTY